MATSNRALALWRQVQLMHLQVTAVLHRGLVDDVGITYQDFIVLSELAGKSHRVVDLARSLGLEKSRLSHHLDRMVERGLVAKEPAPDDRRGSVVVLTTAGRRLYKRALPRHLERVRRHFADHLTAAEAAAIETVVGKVRTTLPE